MKYIYLLLVQIIKSHKNGNILHHIYHLNNSVQSVTIDLKHQKIHENGRLSGHKNT